MTYNSGDNASMMSRARQVRAARRVVGVPAAAAAMVLAHGTMQLAAERQNRPAPAQYELVEELAIRSSDAVGGIQLTRISDLAVLSDGSIAAAHPTERLIRLFDQNGRFLRTLGGAGSGPGEFSALSAIGTIGDTIWVQDLARSSVSFFLADGRLTRSIRYSRQNLPPSTTLVAALPGGRFLFSTNHIPAPPAGQRPSSGAARDSVVYRVADSSGAQAVTVYRQPADPAGRIPFTTNGLRAWFDQPLAPRALFDIEPGSQRVVFSCDGSLCGGAGPELRLVHVDPAGRVVAANVAVDIRPLTPADVDSVRNMFGPTTPPPNANISQASRAAIAAAVREHLYVPRYPPIAAHLIAGRDGSIWIREGRNYLSWLVLERGRVTKRVVIPRTDSYPPEPYQVTADKVWAVLMDADGVPSIRRYGLRQVR